MITEDSHMEKQFQELAEWHVRGKPGFPPVDQVCSLRDLMSSEFRAILDIFYNYTLWFAELLDKDLDFL